MNTCERDREIAWGAGDDCIKSKFSLYIAALEGHVIDNEDEIEYKYGISSSEGWTNREDYLDFRGHAPSLPV